MVEMRMKESTHHQQLAHLQELRDTISKGGGLGVCVCVCVFVCSLLPGNQILISKYLARRGVVVSGGWSNGSGWQPKFQRPISLNTSGLGDCKVARVGGLQHTTN